MTITLINDPKKLNALIKRTHTASVKFAELLHDAGYNAVHHAANTGDTRPLQALYDGLPNAARLALRVWAVKFGPINFAPKGEKLTVKKDRTINPLLGELGPMAYKKEVKAPTKHAFDLKTEIDKLIARANKHNANGSAVALLVKSAQLA